MVAAELYLCASCDRYLVTTTGALTWERPCPACGCAELAYIQTPAQTLVLRP